MSKSSLPVPGYTHEWLPLDELQPHPEIQRALVKAHAEAIAAAFDPDAFGELYVVKTTRGYLIWDGQHRWYAAKKALGDNQLVYCRVYQDVAGADLAKRSLLLNTQKAWNPIDRYKVRVKAGEFKARAVHGVLHQHGLKVASQAEDGCLSAVVACDWIIEKAGGVATLDRVIAILRSAWGRDRDAYHNTLLRSVGLLCNTYNGTLEDKVLAERLAKSGGPARMIGRIRDRAKVDAISSPRAGAVVMVNEYNKGKNKHRLPAFPA